MNAWSGELFKHGTRVRLSKQPFQILLALLAQRGELVTREQLVAEVWGDGTFVDFEHSLNAAMNRLRQSLGDSAEKPRYIETVSGRGYRFIGVVEPAAPQVPVERAIVIEAETPGDNQVGNSRRFWWIAGAVCAIVAVFIVVVAGRMRYPPPTPAPWRFTRLTSDKGNAGSPALSRDGKLLAYSIEKDGARDLYIKQIAGGQPIRLTSDGAGNTSPDFSPDGSKIVFRSERDGGGIYETSAFGGEPRRLAHDGRDPKYSPDGSQVAFWIGDPGINAAVPGNANAWVVPSAGGSPRRVAARLTNARSPSWSPDGRHLLVVGYGSERAYDMSALDWWIVSADGEDAVETGFRNALQPAGLRGDGRETLLLGGDTSTVMPETCWIAGNRVVFSARSGDTRNLWETEISPQGKVKGDFQRLTAGSGEEVNASCTSTDALAFARVETSGTVWSLPFDLNRGKPAGAAELIVRDPSVTREAPSISGDGRRVAFGSNQSGILSIWLRDIAADTETQVAPSRYVQRFASISPSGDRVAYSSYENEKRILYIAAPGGPPEKLCEGCLRATDWSSDEKTLLTFGGSPYQVDLLDLETHKQTPVVAHPAYSLLYGRFSPDQRWISFALRVTPNRSRIMIAPLDGPRPSPENSWIKISEGDSPEDFAIWSPDGKTLYFTSSRDGHICLWAQRIEPDSHQPSGEPFALQHFHERSMNRLRVWSAGNNRIAVVLMEDTSAIWMMSRTDGR